MAVLENSDKQSSQQSNSESLTENEILNILSEDDADKEKEDAKETKAKDKEAEPEEEIKLDAEDIEEEPKEEELEVVVPVRRKEILKKYPNLFKEFPYLEKAYYREQQYTEVFPTLEDAREASEKAENFTKFEEELAKGNTESILKSTKESDEKAFAKIVDSYLPVLAKVDQGAYYHILGNVMKSTIISMVREAENIKNDDLKAAAVILNQFIFGTSNFSAPNQFARGTSQQNNNEEEDTLKEERAAFLNERFETVRDDLSERVSNVLKNTISEHIDPKDSMTPYVKKTAIKECQEELENLIDQDDRFRTVLDNLWRKAFEDNFSKKSLDQIRAAYLSKSKTLLPQIISNVRKSALQGFGRGSNNNESDKRGPLPIGRESSPSKTTQNPKEIPKGMKTLDYLMKD